MRKIDRTRSQRTVRIRKRKARNRELRETELGMKIYRVRRELEHARGQKLRARRLAEKLALPYSVQAQLGLVEKALRPDQMRALDPRMINALVRLSGR